MCCSPYLINASLPAGEREREAQRETCTFNPHVLQKICYALDNAIKELEEQKQCVKTSTRLMDNNMEKIITSLDVTSSPVPCIISKGMAKILLYILTDFLLPLLIFTSRTLKFVPPRSSARNFPFSASEKQIFFSVLLNS